MLLGNSSSPENENLGRIFKMFSSHMVRVLLDLITVTVVQVGRTYASQEDVLAVAWGGYVPGETFPSFEGLRRTDKCHSKHFYAKKIYSAVSLHNKSIFMTKTLYLDTH